MTTPPCYNQQQNIDITTNEITRHTSNSKPIYNRLLYSTKVELFLDYTMQEYLTIQKQQNPQKNDTLSQTEVAEQKGDLLFSTSAMMPTSYE